MRKACLFLILLTFYAAASPPRVFAAEESLFSSDLPPLRLADLTSAVARRYVSKADFLSGSASLDKDSASEAWALASKTLQSPAAESEIVNLIPPKFLPPGWDVVNQSILRRQLLLHEIVEKEHASSKQALGRFSSSAFFRSTEENKLHFRAEATKLKGGGPIIVYGIERNLSHVHLSGNEQYLATAPLEEQAASLEREVLGFFFTDDEWFGNLPTIRVSGTVHPDALLLVFEQYLLSRRRSGRQEDLRETLAQVMEQLVLAVGPVVLVGRDVALLLSQHSLARLRLLAVERLIPVMRRFDRDSGSWSNHLVGCHIVVPSKATRPKIEKYEGRIVGLLLHTDLVTGQLRLQEYLNDRPHGVKAVWEMRSTIEWDVLMSTILPRVRYSMPAVAEEPELVHAYVDDSVSVLAVPQPFRRIWRTARREGKLKLLAFYENGRPVNPYGSGVPTPLVEAFNRRDDLRRNEPFGTWGKLSKVDVVKRYSFVLQALAFGYPLVGEMGRTGFDEIVAQFSGWRLDYDSLLATSDVLVRIEALRRADQLSPNWREWEHIMRLATRGQPVVRHAALKILHQAHPNFGDHVIQILREALSAREAFIREAAVVSLGEIAQKSELAYRLLSRALKDPDIAVRQTALWGLGHSKQQSALLTISKFLSSASPNLKHQAAAALKNFSEFGERATTVLIAALDDPEIGPQVAEALRQDQAAVERAIKVLSGQIRGNDAASSHRRLILMLARLGESSHPVLVKLWHSESLEYRPLILAHLASHEDALSETFDKSWESASSLERANLLLMLESVAEKTSASPAAKRLIHLLARQIIVGSSSERRSAATKLEDMLSSYRGSLDEVVKLLAEGLSMGGEVAMSSKKLLRTIDSEKARDILKCHESWLCGWKKYFLGSIQDERRHLSSLV